MKKKNEAKRNSEKINQLVEDNIALVWWVIHRDFPDCPGNDIDDYFQYGCIGLWNAARLWDDTKNNFSTYATLAIKNRILREILREKERALDIAFSLDGALPDNRSFHEMFGTIDPCKLIDDTIDGFDDSWYRRNLNDTQLELYNWISVGKPIEGFILAHPDITPQAVYLRRQYMRRKWIRMYGPVKGFDEEGKPLKKNKENKK